jgi:hypothetical protein
MKTKNTLPAKKTFKFVERIARGNFGPIWRGYEKATGDLVAIKEMTKELMTDKDV